MRNLYTCTPAQIADFGFTDVRLANKGSNGLIKREFLLLVQFFYDALEGRREKDAHQSNWYSPTGAS